MATNQVSELVERTDVLRIPIHSLPEESMSQVFASLLEDRSLSQILLLRWWDFMRVRRDRELRRTAKDAVMCVPVSKSIVFGARFLRHRRPARHLPFDFTIRLLGSIEDNGRSIYLLGGTPERLRTVEQNLRETFPGLRVVGRYTGYFGKVVESDILTAIRKAGPDFILVGGGVPGGDKWISRHREWLGSAITLCSTEVFEIFADKRARTSRTAFRRGTDFLPDLFRKPWRILRFFVYLWYLFMLLVFKIFGK